MAEVLLSEDEAATVDRGDQARSLLDSPAYLDTVEALRSECSENILTSMPQDTATREDNYNLSRALSAVTERLIAIAAEGEAVLVRAEAETEQPEQTESTHDYTY